MKLNWKTMTRERKNEEFAERVCGMRRVSHPLIQWVTADNVALPNGTLPDYLGDANAVLPWLEKAGRVDIELHPGEGCYVGIYTEPMTLAHAPTFTEAAMIALLRTTRAEVD
jgi:hypothetical protein